MTVFAEPVKWTKTLGSDADYNEIPDTVDDSTGLASKTKIFPAITQIPLSAGGIAPARADFNGLFKLLGDNIYYMQHGGQYSYDASITYTSGALVVYNGVLYQSLKDDNSTTPTETAAWSRLATLNDISENYVTIATEQNVTGNKTFSGENTFSGKNTFSGATSLTGTATSVTPTDSSNDNTIATTAWVKKNASTGDYVDLTSNQTVKGTKTFSAAPYVPTAAVTVNNTQAASTAFVRYMMPAGIIIAFAGTAIPSGFLLCNGSTVSRTTYAALFAAIGTTYGTGNGSTTFTLPDLRDRVLQGYSSSHALGSYLAAGLPNITGGHGFKGGSTAGGCFYLSSDYTNNFKEGTTGNQSVSINAALSSSIYGASSTVQPLALSVQYLIKY